MLRCHNSRLLTRFGFWIACLCIPTRLISQEANTKETPQNSVSAWVESAKVFDNGTQLHSVMKIRSGSTVFGFGLAEGYTVNISNPQNITVSDPRLNYFISARIVSSLETPESRIQTLFPGSNVSQQDSVYTFKAQHPTYLGTWKRGNSPMRQVMAVFVNTSVGTLEITLVSSPESFSEGRNLFVDFLTRAKSSDQGPVKFPPLPILTHS